MTQFIQIFGFGSYFQFENLQPNDIDILLLHSDISTASIQFVIECKKKFIQQLPRAHITMLSAQEEIELDFINKSRGKIIGTVAQITLERDISIVINKIFETRKLTQESVST